MNATARYPSVDAVVPHRGEMLLIDRIVDDDSEHLHMLAHTRRDAWYADADGNMPAFVGVELMAQTVAAFIGLPRWRNGEAPRVGFLLGTRKYTCTASVFPGGATLDVKIRLMYREENGLAAFQCEIEREQQPLAAAVLTVFEPADPAAFMASLDQ